MYCQQCGAVTPHNAKLCQDCVGRHVTYCQKCGTQIVVQAARCPSCGARQKADDSPIHWLSLILLVITFVTFGILGGDYYLQEVNIFDYASIPLAIAALIAAIVAIPGRKIVLKVICIVLSAILVLGTIGWVFL